MPKLPPELKKRIASTDSLEREKAALALRDYPNSESLKHLIGMLSDEKSHVVNTAANSLVSLGSREALEETIPLLRLDDARLRNLAFEIIIKIGAVALSQVVALVNDNDRDVRKFAVEILRQIGGPGTEDPLIRSLFDEDNNVTMAAAEALGIVGTQRAVPHLIECLEREPWLKYAALKSLGEIGGEDALNAILATDPEEESIVLFHAIAALGAMEDSRSLDFLIRLLEKKEPILLPSIIQAIERVIKKVDESTVMETKKIIPISEVILLLKSDNTDLVRSAIVLLGLFREDAAVEELVKLYAESNEHLFDDLEQAFLKIRSGRVEPFVKIIEDQMEPETVKISAVRLLGTLGRKEAFEPLAACLKTAPSGLKKEIIIALSEIEEIRFLPVLHGLLEEEQIEVLEATIEALETFRDDSSISHLMKLSANPSGSVRSMVAKSLRNYNMERYKHDISLLLKAADPEVVCFGLDAIPEILSLELDEDILALCNHKDENVRKSCVERCSFFKDDQAFEMITKAVNDDIPRVRLAGIRGLVNYSAPMLRTLLLNAATSDPEEWIRYEAVKIIGQMSLLDMLPDLISLLESAPDLVKTGILDVLGELGTRKHVEVIKKYAESENEQIREAAVEALERLMIDDG